ncbi:MULTISPECIES: hypothetical protein [unclassified Mycolicibacterium]|uniref:aromatic-ring hydroxylase C-terminal domain-containing protein n=1 Tax=unclassified Mycolicibacterium TaxID=2636767 RepID=UPI0035CB75AD
MCAISFTIATGRPVGEIAATAVLVRPHGYVAWATTEAMPGSDELRELRGALPHWFGASPQWPEFNKHVRRQPFPRCIAGVSFGLASTRRLDVRSAVREPSHSASYPDTRCRRR